MALAKTGIFNSLKPHGYEAELWQEVNKFLFEPVLNTPFRIFDPVKLSVNARTYVREN